MPDLAHRRAAAVVTVQRPDGHPLTDTEVVVAQERHDFLFGNIGFDFLDPAGASTTLADLWFDVFNAATLPFYWGRFEPVRGRPDTARLLAAARWFAERGVVVKGHPLAWHTVGAPWLLDLTTAEIADAQDARIRRDVADFAGVIDTWDVINEVVIMPVFDKEPNGLTRLAWDRGRIPTIRLAFDAARATNPAATLLLNDFDMSTAYECLIEGVLEAGIPVDAIGLQSHMHQGYWGEEKTQAILDRFARFGLPLHLTETTLLSGELMPAHIEDLNDYQVTSWPSTPEGEARQADELERHYRTLLAHPAVEAATYWGITDEGAWLGAPGGLVRADGTPKPAYDALRRLVKEEWWLPPTTLRTDASGRVPVSGFRGTYSVDGVPFPLDGDEEVVVRMGQTSITPVAGSSPVGA
ncbi:endo-1,4-beta-xylanase [Cellulomonas sp. McL0617]|uniref:endo-1,4-beta-xylanase n=1 Tax=Cellulomonas sp. McL0617 TaxID=3415675 RepID=UPI003CE85147